MKFTIVANSELTGPGFSFDFLFDEGDRNDYLRSGSSNDGATVFKDSNGKPTTATIFFKKTRIKNGKTVVVNSVIYYLKKQNT